MSSRMRRSIALVTLLLAAAVTSLGGQTARPAFDRKAVEIPYQKFVLDNGLTLLVHTDHAVPVVGVNLYYHVGSRNERPGKTGFAHLFEHFFFNGSAAPSRRLPRGDGRPGRQQPQRHHEPGPHQLLRGRADVGARAHALPRSRPPRIPGAADQPGDARARARRGAEREAAGREPAVRARVQPHRRDDVSRRPSLQLAGDRQHGGPERRLAAGREGVVRELLRSRTTWCWRWPATSRRNARWRW